MRKLLVVSVGLLSFSGGAMSATFEGQVLEASRLALSAARRTERGFAASKAARQDASWQTVSADGSFTAEMPGAPTYSETQIATASGEMATVRQYVVAYGAGEYAINFITLPYEPADQKVTLQAGLDSAAKGLDGEKWESVTWAEFQGGLSTDSLGLSGGLQVRIFSVVKGKLAFCLAYSGPVGTEKSADAERFIASLKLN